MKALYTAIKIFLFFTVLTGILYPLLITAAAQMLFPWKANGSLVTVHGKVVGSALIGQQFDTVLYFSSRPSVVSYIPLPSGGSNLGVTSAKLKEEVASRKLAFVLENKIDQGTEIPAEMFCASASGLDPHISPRAAMLQVEKVAGARSFTGSQKQELVRLIGHLTEKPQFLIFGEERINVLLLNLETDKIR